MCCIAMYPVSTPTSRTWNLEKSDYLCKNCFSGSCVSVEFAFLWKLLFCGSCFSVEVAFLWKLLFCGSCFSVEVAFLWKLSFCHPLRTFSGTDRY